jgi:hypothetical protein
MLAAHVLPALSLSLRLRRRYRDCQLTIYRRWVKSLSCNTYGHPRKYYKKKTYGFVKPFRCNTYKEHGGVGVLFPFWKNLSGLATSNSCFIQVLSFHIVAHSFAFFCICKKLNSFLFKRFRTLYVKTPGGGVPPPQSQTTGLDYLLMSSFASSLFSSGCRNGFVASGAALIAWVISFAAVGKSPEFDESRASARWLTQ